MCPACGQPMKIISILGTARQKLVAEFADSGRAVLAGGVLSTPEVHKRHCAQRWFAPHTAGRFDFLIRCQDAAPHRTPRLSLAPNLLALHWAGAETAYTYADFLRCHPGPSPSPCPSPLRIRQSDDNLHSPSARVGLQPAFLAAEAQRNTTVCLGRRPGEGVGHSGLRVEIPPLLVWPYHGLGAAVGK